MPSKSLQPLGIGCGFDFKPCLSRIVDLAHTLDGCMPLSVPHLISYARRLLENELTDAGVELLEGRGNLRRHLLDRAKPHADMKPVQDAAAGVRADRTNQISQAVRAIGKHG